MKITGLLTLTLLGVGSTLFGQTNWCGSDAHLQRTFQANPAAVNQFIEHNARISGGSSQDQDRNDPIVIPVVVHVIHDNGIGNISYEQILSGIDMLNEDYNHLNADTIDTRNTANAPFEPISSNMEISFALAKIDPDGNCTNGVERRNSPSATYNAGENAKYYAQGGLDAWPRDQYMNIWIVNSIESDGSGGITLGYAEFPQFATDGYGVIIRHDSYGSIGTASGDRTLTHEIGHCLGLLHTFQGPFFGGGTGCHTSDCASSGDFICDTPPAAASHWDCPATYNSCTSVPTNDFYGFDALDQWENYMSYAPCQNMFSEGQKTMVHGNLVDIAFLADLVSLANQTATGVLSPATLCEASFYSEKQIICAGGSVNFFDESYFNVTGWNWTFEGGTATSTTDQNPTVTYANAGTYDVTLEVTDGISTVSLTLTDYILVLPVPGDNLPYKEGFENLTSIPDNDRFMVVNGNGGTTWELSSSAAYTGTNSAYLNNFGTDDNSIDELISGTIDLSGVDAADPMVFFFRYAYKQRTTSDDEWLRFYISKDCGETWTLRKNIHGTSLGTGVSSSSYTPTQASDWLEVNITNITADYYVEEFRYKIQFENNNGNNIFIDYINMYPESMTGIMEQQELAGIEVYPNPAAESLTLSFVSPAQENCEIVIYDALGNLVGTVYNGALKPGINTFNYESVNLESGVYFISIISEEFQQTIQFVKN